MTIVARLELNALDPSPMLAELIAETSGDGAIATFVGLVRSETTSDSGVVALVLEHHPTLTSRSLEQIAVASSVRFDITHIRLVHRCGTIRAGDPIVFVGVSSVHRRAAFDCVDYIMDRLKTDAVFWKREVGKLGSQWIEPRQTDYADRERWE